MEQLKADAEKGDAGAQRLLDPRSVDQLKADAENGDASAQFLLGLRYANGDGVPQDPVEAVKWIRKAAEQGEPKAQAFLGANYSRGQFLPQNYSEAAKWYQKAAEQGNVWAQLFLGDMYAQGQGVPRDLTEAAKWFRMAAEQGVAIAQSALGRAYMRGEGVPLNDAEAVRWSRKAADQGEARAQALLGYCYDEGKGVLQDHAEAIKWFRMAAEQGVAIAQCSLGFCYDEGNGVPQNYAEAAKWFSKAAEKGFANAQNSIGVSYMYGEGVPQNYIEAHKWFNLASAQGHALARTNLVTIARRMTPDQIAEAQRLAKEFVPHNETTLSQFSSPSEITQSLPSTTGTGFFISEDGFAVTNEHVVRGAGQVRLLTTAGLIAAKVVKVDAANDLALLKAEGRFLPLPVATSRTVRLGGTVATVGFPNIGMQGFAPKLAKGEVASLTGIQDDSRHFQISVPVQPGNSGGALVDERGNVVGIVSAKLSAKMALATTGSLPENVNYAVKSSFLLGFLESVPDVTSRLKGPVVGDRQFEDVAEAATMAAVLVLVY